MDGERLPDREGYRAFFAAMRNGENKALFLQARNEWKSDQAENSELAQYFNMVCFESAINKHYRPAEYQHITDKALKRLPEIKDPAVRQKVARNIGRLAHAWDNAKISVSRAHRELFSDDLKSRADARQAAEPHKTQGQAWFEVKRETDHQFYEHLENLQAKYQRGLDGLIGRALGTQAKIRAATAQSRARQFTSQRVHSAKIDKDHDRER